jgi:hypothetical protein
VPWPRPSPKADKFERDAGTNKHNYLGKTKRTDSEVIPFINLNLKMKQCVCYMVTFNHTFQPEYSKEFAKQLQVAISISKSRRTEIYCLSIAKYLLFSVVDMATKQQALTLQPAT